MKKYALLALLVLLAVFSTSAYAQDASTSITTAFTEAQPNTLDPAAASSADEFLVLRNVCEGLVDADPVTNEPVPALAESWDVSDDGLVYTFHLRSGVTFSDGSSFEAADVKYSFDRLANRETGTSYTAGLVLGVVAGWSDVRPATPKVGDGTPTPEPVTPATSISGVQVIDDSTVQITLSSPVSAFLERMTLPGADVVAEGSGDNADFSTNPVCTGPYVVSDFQAQQSVTLTANENYWNGAPDVKTVLIRVIPDKSVQMLEYEAGNLDIVAVPPSDIGRIRDDATLSQQLVEIPTLSTFSLRMNLADPLLSDPAVRRALSGAIDRQLIVDTVLQGQAVPAYGLFPPGLPTHDPNFMPLPYDPEKIKQDLADAGYPDGVSIEFRTGQDETERRVLNAIAQTAAPAGINITVNATEKSVWDQDRAACNYQAGSVAWGLDYPDAENVAALALPGTSASRINCHYGDYENEPQAQDLFNQAVSMPLGADRDAVWHQFQQLTVGEEAVVIPLYHGVSTSLVAPRIGGTPIDNQGNRRFALITLQ